MNSAKHTLLSCLVALAVARPAAAADEAPVWELLPAVKVDSTGIFLNEVILQHNTTAVLPQIRLAPAPGLGQTASLSRILVTELVQKYASELYTTNWSGAAQVRVTRRTRQLIDSELTDLLTATLQREHVKDRGELELRLTRPWTPVLVPDEPLTLKVVELPASGVNANFVVRFELWNGREHVGDWQQPVAARVWRDVPVAHSALVRGELLRDADVTLERRDLLAERDAFLNFPNAAGTFELNENIPAGMPVFNHSVRERPLIRRGRLVEGVYQDGGLSISLKVESLEDGLLGQTVRVRNPKTNREVYGKVQNEDTVLIAL